MTIFGRSVCFYERIPMGNFASVSAHRLGRLPADARNPLLVVVVGGAHHEHA